MTASASPIPEVLMGYLRPDELAAITDGKLVYNTPAYDDICKILHRVAVERRQYETQLKMTLDCIRTGE